MKSPLYCRLSCEFGIVFSSKSPLHVRLLEIEYLTRCISEGSSVLFRVALTLFKLSEPTIMNLTDSLEIFQVVQVICSCRPDMLAPLYKQINTLPTCTIEHAKKDD